MTAPGTEQTPKPLSQSALEEIAGVLSAHEDLVYVLYVRDDVADSAIDVFGPDAGNAGRLVAALSHAGPEPHRIDNKSDPLTDEESKVLACVERLRSSSAEFILAWRRTAQHAVRIAYSPDRPWRDVLDELRDLVLFNHS